MDWQFIYCSFKVSKWLEQNYKSKLIIQSKGSREKTKTWEFPGKMTMTTVFFLRNQDR